MKNLIRQSVNCTSQSLTFWGVGGAYQTVTTNLLEVWVVVLAMSPWNLGSLLYCKRIVWELSSGRFCQNCNNKPSGLSSASWKFWKHVYQTPTASHFEVWAVVPAACAPTTLDSNFDVWWLMTTWWILKAYYYADFEANQRARVGKVGKGQIRQKSWLWKQVEADNAFAGHEFWRCTSMYVSLVEIWTIEYLLRNGCALDYSAFLFLRSN